MDAALRSRPLRAGVVVTLTVLLALSWAAGLVSAQAQLSLAASPALPCTGEGDVPEPAQQGRVPASVYADGWTEPFSCNLDLLHHHGATGGYKVLRHVDADGTPCLFHDSTLIYPLDAAAQGADGSGVVVLDVTDPAAPVQTANLTTPAMLSPHESLVLNAERGLLVAITGSPTTTPAVVDVYDVDTDCTEPVLLSSTENGVLGHESGLSPDGRTLYVTSPFFSTFSVVDLEDPTAPVTLYTGEHQSHGVTVSADNTRAYLSPVFGVGNGREPFYSHSELVLDGDGTGGLEIIDVTALHEREPGAAPAFVSELTWPEVSIPQAALPFTVDGAPYLLEVDEFVNFFDGVSYLTPSGGFEERVPGAVRIIDIGDETAPFVRSNIRLEVHDPAVRVTDGILDDPGARSPGHGYAAHYCALPTTVDPTVVACSMILSGLRVFDISDLDAPVEIAHFNAPGNPGSPPINPDGAPYAMSAPAFDVDTRTIWYSDTASGLYAVRVDEAVWPAARDERGAGGTAASAPGPAADPSGDGLAATGPVVPLALPGAAALLVGAALARRRADEPAAARRWPWFRAG